MDVYWVSDEGVGQRSVDELDILRKHDDGFVWVDISSCDEEAARLLADTFHCHPMAVRDCVRRNHISKVHVYAEQVFVVLHEPEVGRRGHVHYVELDQFIAPRHLITVHGPLNPAVPPEIALRQTRAVLHRLKQGHLRPKTPFELSHAIVSALVRHSSELVASLAQQCGQLEQRVMLGEVKNDPETFTEALFKIWYELLAVRTMAAAGRETYGRMLALAPTAPVVSQAHAADLMDQLHRVRNLADGQREFLHGVIEFFETRTNTEMALSADRMASMGVRQNEDMRKITAWVAIIAVPTAVTGWFGQNIPYPGFGTTAGFVASTAVILISALVLYILFKRKEWL